MENDFDNLIGHTDESEDTYSSIYSSRRGSIISVLNDEGEEEVIDLDKFYRQKSIKRKKESVYAKFKEQKEASPSSATDDPITVDPAESSRHLNPKLNFRRLPFYRDHHLRTALDIQEKAQDM